MKNVKKKSIIGFWVLAVSAMVSTLLLPGSTTLADPTYEVTAQLPQIGSGYLFSAVGMVEASEVVSTLGVQTVGQEGCSEWFEVKWVEENKQHNVWIVGDTGMAYYSPPYMPPDSYLRNLVTGWWPGGSDIWYADIAHPSR